MKRLLILTTALLVSTFSFAYEWDSIGPSDLHVNNFNTVYYNILIEILSTTDGILINEGDNWVEYTYGGLPAWSAVGLDPNNILVLFGDGSYSDGVYKFNLGTHQFEVVEWIVFPNFLQYCEYDNTYYAGGEYGMWKSTDGLSFTSIEYFDMMNCIAFAWFDNHFVVSADGNTHCSHDSGETWTQTTTGSPIIFDMAFHDNGILYGVFPSSSNSSGLWSSVDFGETWEVEFYDLLMSSVGIDIEGNIFIGWENYGIAQWDPVTHEFEVFNDGLPDLNINKITTHPYIDCNNIVACTDSGSYMLTNYLVGIEEETSLNQRFSLSNYPNPFINTTTILFSVDETSPATINMYDVHGNKVTTLFNGIAESGQKYKFEFDGTALSEGIYYCHLQSGAGINTVKRIVLVK